MSRRSRLVSHGKLVGRYLWKQVQWEMRRPLTTSLQMERTMSLPQSGLAVFGFVLLIYAIHSFWGRRRRRKRESGPSSTIFHPMVPAKPSNNSKISLSYQKCAGMVTCPFLDQILKLKTTSIETTNWIFNLFNIFKAHFSCWLSFLLLLLAGDVELNPGPYGSKCLTIAT